MSGKPGESAGCSVGQCAYCGSAMEKAARFCSGCGRPKTVMDAVGLHALSFLQSNLPAEFVDRITRSGASMVGERKHVTVVFADVRGSTALIDQLDPEEALEVLGPVLKRLMDAVHQHDGLVNQARGDGVMALFGAPIASEDHAVQACRAALAMRTTILEHNRLTSSDIGIRVGINSGQVVIHSIGNNLAMNYDAVGKTVHLAARMEELASPEAILITLATVELARGYINTLPRGLVTVRGMSDPIDTFELQSMRPKTRWQVRSARGLSMLIGRQAELASLRDNLERTSAANGQAVMVTGTAGVGKSRLVHDFIRNLPDEWTVLETSCAPQHINSSYYPVSTLIRAIFGINFTDAPDVVAKRITDGIARLDPSLSTIIPPLLSLLDLGAGREWNRLAPSEKRNKIVEAIRSLISYQERTTPLVILIEDVHWIDAETNLILSNLVGWLGSARILIIATQRPEANCSGGIVNSVALTALNEADSRQLLDWLMGNDRGLEHIKRRILAHAQGNPLFLEELVQALKDKMVLIGNPGSYRVSTISTNIDVPLTIHSVLAARIDLLDGMSKSLLQTAAVIGQIVPVALLCGLIGAYPEEIADGLQTLERNDFLHKLGTSEATVYTFKHELTREVAYGTMLISTRRTLHAKAVEVIESRFADRLEEHIDRLADHAFLAELWQKATPYQLRSCRRAAKRGANQDAIGIFERGLRALGHWPESTDRLNAEIDLRLTVIIALEPLGQHRRIAQVLREARNFAEQSGDPWRMAAVNCQLAVALWRLGDHSGAMTASESARVISERIGDPALTFASLHNMGIVHHEIGAFTTALELFDQCLALETPDLDEKRAGWAAYPSVVLRAFIADSLVDLGETERAETIALDALNRAQAANHAYSRANIGHVLGRVLTAQGRHDEALSMLKENWQVCLDLGMLQMYPIFAARIGEAHLAAGDLDAALQILSVPEQLDVPLAEHAFGWRFLFVAQGRAFLADGRFAEAKAVAERALALASERGELPQEAFAKKLLGDIASAANQGESAEAEECFEHAFRLAEKCSMRPLMASCCNALADLATRKEQPDLARTYFARAAAYSEKGATPILASSSAPPGREPR
jgi:class 3 adenylate cyclase/tetratricopeptide (TPR) repeat protein